MNLRIICLMVIIFTSRFGLAHTYVALNLNPFEQSLTPCVSSLQVIQDYELLDEDFFNIIVEPNYRAVQRALEAGANPNAFVMKVVGDSDDGEVDFRYLIDLGALEKVTDKQDLLVGGTALHLAVMMGNPHIVNLLLEFKARVDIRSVKGLTPFSIIAYQNVDVVGSIDRRLMVLFFIESKKLEESDITYTFEQAAIKKDYLVVEAIAEHAPNSEVIKRLRNTRLISSHISYLVSDMLPSTSRVKKKEAYYLAHEHLKQKGLL